MLTNQDIGTLGEKLAARHLKKKGYRIIGRNLHFSKNEIDLVVKDRHFLVFVEVKTRTYADPANADSERPALAVNRDKRMRTLQAIHAYLQENPTKLCPRADVVEVFLDSRAKPFQINHVEAAFQANGKLR